MHIDNKSLNKFSLSFSILYLDIKWKENYNITGLFINTLKKTSKTKANLSLFC